MSALPCWTGSRHSKGRADSTAAAACRHTALNASAILGRFIGLAVTRRSEIRSSEGTGPLVKSRLGAWLGLPHLLTVRCRSDRASQASDESPLGFALRSSQFFNCFARGCPRSLVIESKPLSFHCAAPAFSMTRCRSSWHSAMSVALNALRDAAASLAFIRERCQHMAWDVTGIKPLLVPPISSTIVCLVAVGRTFFDRPAATLVLTSSVHQSARAEAPLIIGHQRSAS